MFKSRVCLLNILGWTTLPNSKAKVPQDPTLTLIIWDNSTVIKGSTAFVGGFTVTVRTLDMTARGLLLVKLAMSLE